MKVYVETNWLLDLALEQERIKASSFVAELAKDNKIRLYLPEISLVEADQKIVRRRLQREILIENLRQEGRELVRIRDTRYQAQAAAIDHDIFQLRDISDFEREHFNAIVRDISRFLTWLHLDNDSLQKSFDFENNYELSRLDALIYAVIRADATSDLASDKCFIDYDGHFKNPELKRDMTGPGIILLSSPESVCFAHRRLRITVENFLKSVENFLKSKVS
jgi:predicted nucleic acid-binding protein